MDTLKSTYLNKNPIIRIFSRTKVNIAIKMARLNKADKILDFGCGEGWLKNKLKNQGFYVVGYDKTPEHTEIKDYTELSFNKIFALDVFEHIPKEEIVKIIKNLKKKNKKFELITAIPTENLVSRKMRKFLGKSEKVPDHITSLKEIVSILRKELRQVKSFNFLTVSYIAKFRSD
jgi:2-polyprenyl-3-methyl-5-hydroxy-6-metoxy-1,4-benzoquinol methylase